MKINIIVDSTGKIVGMAGQTIPEKGTKAKASDMDVGIAPSPGQSIHEVEITDEHAQLEGPELLKRLYDIDTVKKALGTIMMAGQGE